jgi:hypothetical protein
MSKHETELRRRLADNKADLYETIAWFLAAIDAQGYADGKRGALLARAGVPVPMAISTSVIGGVLLEEICLKLIFRPSGNFPEGGRR